MSIALETRNLTRIIPGDIPVTLISDVSIKINKGELMAITGASGSGKSSLLYLMGLLDTPTEGQVLIEDKNTAPLDGHAKARLRLEKIGFVFQFHFLIAELNALENVMLPMKRLGRLPGSGIEERAKEILSGLGITERLDKKPGQFSGGQRQRISIARALANDPDIILADEPTGNLDSKNAAVVFDVFRRLAEEKGKTIIAVTHELELAAKCHRQLHIVDGKIAV